MDHDRAMICTAFQEFAADPAQVSPHLLFQRHAGANAGMDEQVIADLQPIAEAIEQDLLVVAHQEAVAVTRQVTGSRPFNYAGTGRTAVDKVAKKHQMAAGRASLQVGLNRLEQPVQRVEAAAGPACPGS